VGVASTRLGSALLKSLRKGNAVHKPEAPSIQVSDPQVALKDLPLPDKRKVKPEFSSKKLAKQIEQQASRELVAATAARKAALLEAKKRA
jgi:hypothetical protein